MIPEWAMGVGVIIIAVTLARTIGSLVRGGTPRRLRNANPDGEADVSELRQTVDSLQQRLAEVEERLDFAERLLAKPPPPR
jgi:hypothetical protein